ncbi:MAG: hypothetical protein HFE95_03785 [Acutalibacter sp.]|nr:hypothetical protein [Acutalibacter sp.]
MRRGWTALGLGLLALLWGLCWLLEPHVETAQVQAIILGSQDGEGSPVISPGGTAEGGMAFRNQGRSSCRLRVRLCVDKVGGKPVLEAGEQTRGGFRPAGTGEPKGGEYWTARGEYLYYENERTGGLLLPGRETPAVYTTVRLNRELAQAELAAAGRLGGEQKLYLMVEAQAE